ncbi:MAG: pyruvate kinase [Gammaproteobacteria bacterium]|nr:pyruvate kinase [Gammaproteobacteria bacterium]
MNKEIFCTLGPSSLNDRVITRLEEIGINLFRLNLSHTKLKDLANTIQYIQTISSVPICLDTEGAQIRTGNLLQEKIYVRENSVVRIHRLPVPGDSNNFNLYPDYIIDKLEVGDFISVDSSVLVKVIDIEATCVVTQILCGGEIGQNKAVTVERDILMPALTEKDIKALAIGRDMDIRQVALSFANRASDVDEIREAFRKDAFVFSKIECRNALQNLAEIASKSYALLIDRGDLSRQVPIEQIPAVQKHIVLEGKKAGIKVYVATNLMESMVTQPTPTRAEANDVFNTLADGADGLVLAAETAIGHYPVKCATVVAKIIHEFENSHKRNGNDYPATSISLLNDPHGSSLINRKAEVTAIHDLRKLRSLTITETELIDCELIANGTYSPLTGFMGRDALESVLNTHRLPNGLAWPIPILLQIDREAAKQIGEGECLTLKSATGQLAAILEVREIYSFDLQEMIRRWFGATSGSHPGMAKLKAGGNVFIGGEVTLVQSVSNSFAPYKLTPAEARFIFNKKGWSKVVGFRACTVPDCAHQFVQLDALETTHADGLFISIMMGPRTVGDFLPGPILQSYQLMLDFGLYPIGKAVLGCSSDYPRYGPREAVFAAICSKNMGCDCHIVDCDYTGFGHFYKDYDLRKLFDELGDIGIKPLFYDAVGHGPQKQKYSSLESTQALRLNNVELLEAIRQKRELPEWCYIPEVLQYMLRVELVEGKKMLCE